MKHKLIILITLILITQITFATDLAAIVAHDYNFNETSGSTAYDSSTLASKSDGTITGATINQTGILNKAYSFNGLQNRVINASDVRNNPAAFSFNIWVKPTGNPASGDIFMIGGTDPNTQNSGWQALYTNSGGTYQLHFVYLRTAGGEIRQIKNLASPLSTTNWTMLTFTLGAAGSKIYVNGSISDTNATSTNYIQAAQPLVIGVDSRNYTNNLGWDGLMDNPTLFNEQLNDTNISSIYNGGIGKAYPFISASIDANFTASVNKSTQTIQLTDTSTGSSITINDWNWLVNGSTTGLSDPNAQNPTFGTITQNTDYNICLSVGGLGNDSVTYTDSLCQTINSGRLFGWLHFVFYDENTGSALNSVTVDYNGTPVTTALNIYDLNLQGITSQTYDFNFSKTNYSTRRFQLDLNQYADFNYSLLMLDSNKSLSTEFQFFNPTATTILANSYVTVTNFYRNKYTERIRTDDLGYATFQLNTSDGNYGFHIEYGTTTYDYNSVSLAISRPKDEMTLADINANWSEQTTGVAIFTDTNILGNTKTLLLYADTTSPYSIRIGSLYNSGGITYFSRSYNIIIPGYPGSQTLQPYLLSSDDGLSQAIKTQNLATLAPVPSINVKIYKLLQGTGRTLVEEVTTSSSGDATWTAASGETYYFDVYQNNVLVQQLTETGFSTANHVYYIYFNAGSIDKPDLNLNNFIVNFYPSTSFIQSFITDLNQVVSATSANAISYIQVQVTNTDVNGVNGNNVVIYSNYIPNPTLPYTNSIPIDSTNKTLNLIPYDTNGQLIVLVTINNSDGNVYATWTYTPYGIFNPVNSFGYGLRPLFGCSASNNPMIPCGSLLLLGLFLSVVISTAVGVTTGNLSFGSIGFLFLFIAGIFTYLTWIPYILYAIMLAGVFGLIIAQGGRRL